MNKRLFKLMAALLLPLAVNAQNSIFNDGEATTGAIRNLAHNASTGTEAAIYNPAGLTFSPGRFAISVNGTANYQKVHCKPYSLDENGEKVYGWEQDATLKGIYPSVQGYVKIKKGTISFSFANEGGVRWGDPDGDVFENYLLENNYSLEELSSGICQMLQEDDLLANEDDYLHWSTSNYVNQTYNWCARLGGSYDLGSGFSAYLGVRYNHIKSYATSENDLFVFIPSKQQKSSFIEYYTAVYKAKNLGNLTEEQELLLHQLDSVIHNGVQVSYDYPLTNLHTFSPVVGFAYNYKTLNVGLKYEMSPSIYMDTDGIFLPHAFSAGVSNLFWNRLLVSVSADLKWGFKGNDAIHISAESNPIVYQFGLGLDFDVTERFKLSASAVGGNTVTYISYLGTPLEYISSSLWGGKVSCGAQCKIGNNFLVDFGVLMSLRNVSIDQRNTINNTFHWNCEYYFGNRFAAGLGLTYVLN